MNLEPAIESFKIEAQELVSEMETIFLQLESDSGDDEAINSVFRAAHTIKGSAGLFGFDETVRFTHEIESILMMARDHELTISHELCEIMIRCCDQISEMVSHTSLEGEDFEEKTLSLSQTLLSELTSLAGIPATQAISETEESARVEKPTLAEGGSEYWHLSFRPSTDALTDGFDPISIISYLSNLGEVVYVATVEDYLPSWSDYNPENCYLGFEVALDSKLSKNEVEGAFEFVIDDWELHVLPPHSTSQEFIKLIHQLPETDAKLGEILVACQAITKRELDDALSAKDSGLVEKPIGEKLTDSKIICPTVVDVAINKQSKIRDKSKSNDNRQFLRVDTTRLDELINLIGELVITGASSNLLAAQSEDPELVESIEQMSHLTEDIRSRCLSLRMVEIGQTLARFHRIVRDVSKETGKEIDLTIQGEETELDKSMVEKITDPLLHLVRNAIDHGIEPKEQRIALGKPEKGRLSIAAIHDSGGIVIEVTDDGRGLNKDRIIEKAIDNGLITSTDGMTQSDIFKLIFQPGFSTAEEVTDISGRGVGMDVVRRNIEAMRGTIDIDSTPNIGSKISIRLPLTLAIIDGFQMRVAECRYILPLDSVVECVEQDHLNAKTFQDNNCFNLRGEILPVVRLRELFSEPNEPQLHESIIVVEHSGHRVGIVVDELLGEFQTVVKPMSQLFEHQKWISGSTILGNGAVAVILEVAGLVNIAKQKTKDNYIRQEALN